MYPRLSVWASEQVHVLSLLLSALPSRDVCCHFIPAFPRGFLHISACTLQASVRPKTLSWLLEQELEGGPPWEELQPLGAPQCTEDVLERPSILGQGLCHSLSATQGQTTDLSLTLAPVF